MPFEKNDSRINRAGKKPGTPNKINQEIRGRINEFLDNNFETIQNDLMQLEARERVKFYIELLQYGLPKLKQVELTNDPDAISHEDLDMVLNMLADVR
jgi:hypothetical protein